MKKILIRIDDVSLIITYKNQRKIREDLINTNVISDNELLFGSDYFKENAKIIELFLKELCEIKKCHQVIFENNELAKFLIPYFNNIHPIQKIYIQKEETLSYAICELIISSKYIKEINSYNIPSYMIEILDHNYIQSETRSEFFFTSPFMQNNNLIQYSKIYYKMNINLELPLLEDDRSDFINFCKINRYLKKIKLENFNKDDLEFIIKTSKENHLKNIQIHINGNLATQEIAEYLKKINKENKHKKIKCLFTYSEDYLKDNLFKQIILNTIKICGIIILILVGSVVAYVGTRNYVAMKKDNAIQENISEVIHNGKEPSIPIVPDDKELIIKNQYIASILTINPDVVGWLKVNNTKIDYPVLRAKDNLVYLKNNLYKQNDINGWIFMDYRNTDESLNQNTIIYGHNMYYSGIMFGTLHKALNKNWYDKKENQIISFNTMYETLNWQIFSIYKIKKTNDYLNVKFANDKDFQDYINLVEKRSITNFNIEVTPKDKILTLSTCTGDNERLVIHAKKIKES